jgi:hypothetical protein
MSIASTITALERASAAHKAANTAIAKRGMFALVERQHRYTSLLHGAYAGYVGYTPCIVSSVDRAGIVKEVRLTGQSWPLKRRDWHEIIVDSANRIADPAGVAQQLVENGRAIEYHSQAEAIIAIKRATGMAP